MNADEQGTTLFLKISRKGGCNVKIKTPTLPYIILIKIVFLTKNKIAIDQIKLNNHYYPNPPQ